MTQIEQEHTGLATLDTSTETVEALLDGVSPGPWVRNGTLRNGVIRYCVQAFDGEVDITFQVDEKEDATFITAARELVPALLAERDALKAEVVKLRAERNHANDVTDAAVEEIERLKAQADEIWNEAIEEAAQMMSVGGRHTIRDRTEAILTLKRPVKGESHE